MNIATPNKRGFAGSYNLWQDISKGVNAEGTMIYHEATVCAGLPVISTLKDLIHTGDSVTKIEGIFSGTLSFIFNVFSSGNRPFSDVVTEAKEKGYTEPDPRDDLNGMDVARKLTILARLVGLEIEGPPHAFEIESLIPKDLENCATAEEFMAKLPQYDHGKNIIREEAQTEAKVLRYVGNIDVTRGVIKVGVEGYPTTHPFAGLQGSDNIVAFYTKRYGDRPLIVQGAGYKKLSYKADDSAGAEVTAMGVLSDILKIVERV